MKRRVLIGALLWTLLISASQVHLNVGWRALARNFGFAGDSERAELLVGFLPVT